MTRIASPRSLLHRARVRRVRRSARSRSSTSARASRRSSTRTTSSAPSNTKISEFAVAAVRARAGHAAFSVRRRDVVRAVARRADGARQDDDERHLRAHRHAGPRELRRSAPISSCSRRASTFRRDSPRCRGSRSLAASLIGSDFLAFPISNMGTGFGGTGGIALARPLGDWNLGVGASVRRSSQYDPFDVGGGPALHYQPGNEYRARVGVDRAFGTGRVDARPDLLGVRRRRPRRLGLQHRRSLSHAVRLEQQLRRGRAIAQRLGPVPHRRHARRRHRDSATRTSPTAALSYGVHVGSATIIEPNVEGRVVDAATGSSTSTMATLGVRSQFALAGFAVSPSVGLFGRPSSRRRTTRRNTTASLTGFHATLAVRLR